MGLLHPSSRQKLFLQADKLHRDLHRHQQELQNFPEYNIYAEYLSAAELLHSELHQQVRRHQKSRDHLGINTKLKNNRAVQKADSSHPEFQK